MQCAFSNCNAVQHLCATLLGVFVGLQLLFYSPFFLLQAFCFVISFKVNTASFRDSACSTYLLHIILALASNLHCCPLADIILSLVIRFKRLFSITIAIVICRTQEKGNSALHIATQANQSSQVELLLVYGADPGSFDSHGRTSADIARFSAAVVIHNYSERNLSV